MLSNIPKKEWSKIKTLYTEKRLSLLKIAIKYKAVSQDIRKILAEKGVKIRGKGKQNTLPSAEVLRKEIEQVGKATAVAVKYGVTDGAITHKLQRYDGKGVRIEKEPTIVDAILKREEINEYA